MSEATRLEQSLAAVEKERFDLAEVVQGCVEGYRLAHDGRDFLVEIDPGPWPVVGSPDLIAQMLDKLAANAVEFSDAGKPIRFGLQRDGGLARLTVFNEGPPLPAGMQDRLFESMVSVRDKAPEDDPHLGLGLYIVRLIAEFHGARAGARNRTDPAGVEFRVDLPLAP
jgi:signal transduction histidine kinase